MASAGQVSAPRCVLCGSGVMLIMVVSCSVLWLTRMLGLVGAYWMVVMVVATRPCWLDTNPLDLCTYGVLLCVCVFVYVRARLQTAPSAPLLWKSCTCSRLCCMPPSLLHPSAGPGILALAPAS